MTELTCPFCGGKLEPDKKNSNIEICNPCNKKYIVECIYSQATGENRIELRLVPEKMAYEPVEKKESKKTGWEPYGWERGVALVILFFVLMGMMYGPKVYQRYQMDHGGMQTEAGQEDVPIREP